MKLLIVTINSQDPLLLDFDSSESIRHLKARIQNQEHIPAEDQIIIYHCKPLHDDFVLGDYDIRHEDTLLLSRKLRGGMYQPLSPHDNDFPHDIEEIKIENEGKYKTTFEDVIEDVMANKNLLPPAYHDGSKGITSLQKDFMEKIKIKEEMMHSNPEYWSTVISDQKFESNIVCTAASSSGMYFILAERTCIHIFNTIKKSIEHTFKNKPQEKENRDIELEVPQGAITVLAVSEDSHYLIGGTIQNDLFIYDLPAKKCIKRFLKLQEGKTHFLISINLEQITQIIIVNKQLSEDSEPLSEPINKLILALSRSGNLNVYSMDYGKKLEISFDTLNVQSKSYIIIWNVNCV